MFAKLHDLIPFRSPNFIANYCKMSAQFDRDNRPFLHDVTIGQDRRVFPMPYRRGITPLFFVTFCIWRWVVLVKTLRMTSGKPLSLSASQIIISSIIVLSLIAECIEPADGIDWLQHARHPFLYLRQYGL